MSPLEREIPPGTSPEHPRIVSSLEIKDATKANPELEISHEDKEILEATRERQTVLNIVYTNFNGEYEQGQLVVDRAIAKDIQKIFSELLARKFPIASIKPITQYEWSDDKSMEAGNSSGTNFRFVGDTRKLSLHSFGVAIDINPKQNPMIIGQNTYPPGATYDQANPGSVTSEVVELFAQYGFEWDGNWQSLKDYQHFQVSPETLRNRALKAIETDPENEVAANEAAWWQKIVDLQNRQKISQ